MDPVTRKRQLELEGLLQEQLRRRSRRKLARYYPETGPLRRALYPKHLAFFEGGRHYRQRLMLAANRIGKTEGGMRPAITSLQPVPSCVVTAHR